MDKQQAQKIVDGLRAAEDAKGAVVELLGEEARNFKFVKELSWEVRFPCASAVYSRSRQCIFAVAATWVPRAIRPIYRSDLLRSPRCPRAPRLLCSRPRRVGSTRGVASSA